MSFGSPGGTRGANIVFDADTGKAKAGITDLGRVYQRTTGAMSTDALRLVAAQDRLNKTISRSGPESAGAARATVAYRKEIESIASAANRETAALDRTNRELGQATRGALAGSGAFRGLGRSLAFASGGFLGAAGLVHGIRLALDASSALAEQVDATNRVFKSSAPVVEDWANHALGLARDQALGAANGIGTLLVPLGILPGEAAKTSVQLTKLGVDLASLKDTPVPAALEAIRSGLVGESEPLRRYGVLLSEARVQQVALTETGKTSAKELTNREKVMARVAIIMRDSGLAENNYRDTIASTANQEREAQKNFRNTAILVGDTLQPAYRNLLGDVNAYLGNAENQKKIQEQVNRVVETGGDVAHGLAEAFDDIHDVLEPLISLLGGTEKAIELLVIAMAAGKVRSFATALGLIGPAAVKAATVSTAATEIEVAGAAALTASGRVAGLRGSLLGLSSLSPIVIPITLAVLAKEISESGPGKALHLDYSGIDLAKDAFDQTIGRIPGASAVFGGGDSKSAVPSGPAPLDWFSVVDAITQGYLSPAQLAPLEDRFANTKTFDAAMTYARQVAARNAVLYGSRSGSGTAGSLPPPHLGAGALRDLAIQRAQTTAGTADDAAAANAVLSANTPRIRFLEARIRGGKGNLQKEAALLQQLYSETASAQGTIDSINAAAASKSAEAARAASAKRAEAARKAAAAARKEAAAAKKRADEAAALRKEIAKGDEAAFKIQASLGAGIVAFGGRPSVYTLPGANPGLLRGGNIDIANRPVAHNADGSISTVKSFSINVDGEEILIPQVVNGKVVSQKAAIDHYFKTKQNLGVFKSAAAADAYAQRLHNEQARLYGRDRGLPSVVKGALAIRLTAGVSPELQLAELNARTEEQRVKILRRELKALNDQYHEAKRAHLRTKDLLTIAQERESVRSQLASIEKGKAGAKGPVYTAGELRDSFLSDVQRIVGHYSPNFNLGASGGLGGGKAETHLHNLVHETRQTNAHLRTVVGRGKQPSSGYATEAALAAFG